MGSFHGYKWNDSDEMERAKDGDGMCRAQHRVAPVRNAHTLDWDGSCSKSN